MKRLLTIFGILVLAAAGTVLLAPFLVSADAVKSTVEARLQDWTGRRVTLAGPAKLSLFPNLVAHIESVEIANIQGMGDEPLMRMEALQASVRLLPLLSGRVEIGKIELVRPQINLVVDQSGQSNWSVAADPAGPAASSATPADAPSAGGASVQFAGIGAFVIVDGQMTYANARTGSTVKATALNLTLDWPTLKSPLNANGNLVWNGETVNLAASIAQPMELASGMASKVAIDVDASPLNATVSGQMSMAADVAIDGAIELSAPSVRAAARWLGADIPAGNGLRALSLSSPLTWGGGKLSFSRTKLAMDGNNAEGAVIIRVGGKKPLVQATLALTTLDLNPYLGVAPAPDADAAQTGTAAGTAAAPAPGGTPAADGQWSTDPLNLSGLHAIDADLRLSAGRIVARDYPLGAGALTIALQDGRVTAQIAELEGYGGKINTVLVVNATQKTPSYSLDLAARNVALEPFLKDWANFKRVAATGSVDAKLQSVGAHQQAIISNLAGTVQVQAVQGRIIGVDLAGLAGILQTQKLTGWNSTGEQQTPFDLLQASYVISQGIAQNNDLIMQGPAVQLEGAGTVDLPQRMLDYRVNTALLSAPAATPVAGAAPVLQLPVLVRGPWTRPQIFIDPAGLIQNLPVAKQTIEGVRDAIKRGDVKGIEDAVEDSGLKDLFNNLTGRKKKK